MSLDETKRLLRTSRIVPNRLLGQNFMVEPAFYVKLSKYACLNNEDVVLDAGAGFGFLSRYLADKCKAVVSIEKDPRIAAVLREQVKGCGNVHTLEGDFLKTKLPPFNKVVSIPPYYLSSKLILWLLGRKIPCIVLVLQREFAEKLVAQVGSPDYSWLTVITAFGMQTDLLDDVPKNMFYPIPDVDSVIVRMIQWEIVPFRVNDELFFTRLVRWLFSQRNKRISNALVPFLRSMGRLTKNDAQKLASSVPFSDRRARELSPREFGELVNALKA